MMFSMKHSHEVIMAKKPDHTLTQKELQKPSKASRELIKPRKEVLFRHFYISAVETLSALEIQFNVDGVCDQVFGKGADAPGPADEDEAKMERLRANYAWATLSALYDYAVDGLDNSPDGASSLVIDGSDVLWLVTSENFNPGKEWLDIVAMGDGRFALDDGLPVEPGKVALLANVDLRTVRNAISSGELTTANWNDETFIENASARRWLLGRKGFKPTVLQEDVVVKDVAAINTPAMFGAFLVERRKRLGLDLESGKVLVMHPSVNPETQAQLESGAFPLSLSAVFPLADFYQVGRKAFLDCVMRVFFPEQLATLRDAIKTV
jgi:hypothetical protein